MITYLLRFSFLGILIGLLAYNVNAQDISIEIKVTTDDFPQDLSWEILNNRSEVVHAMSLVDCDPNTLCATTVQIDSAQCYTFIIRDRFGDGIELGGGYQVYKEAQLIIDENFAGENAQHDLNCKQGESCTQAIQLNLPTPLDEKIKAPKGKDFWFKITPSEFGLYRLTTCVNLISGQGYPDTKLWIYDNCDRDLITEGPEGALGLSDDFIQCEPSSAFHLFPMQADTDYFIRVRREPDQLVTLDSIELRVFRLPSIFGCMDPGSCNYNPFANIEDGSCVYDDNCRPDLSLDQDALETSLLVDTIFTNDQCLIAEGCLRGPGDREVIRFSTKIDNIGTADYLLGSPEEGTNNFSRTNCHGHWHQEGYAEYLLFDGDGVPEPLGFKTGFCVLDYSCSDKIPRYVCSYMGISAGCSDIYTTEVECQWIDVTDVPDGVYTLVVRVNWSRFPDVRGFDEMSYENNWGQVCFDLDRSSGQTIVTILDECPQYQDCLGFAYGQAEIDCEGVCGGSAHYGDINGSGELDAVDIGIYMSMLENGSDENSPCFDLNADGILNIYDAVLTHECNEANTDISGNIFHNHCTFPGGFINTQETVFVRIANHNESDRYFDIEVWAQTNDLSGIELKINGTHITSVDKLYDTPSDFFVRNANTIYALHGFNNYHREIAYAPFARVYYEEIFAEDICIDQSSMIINANYDQVSIFLEESCIFSSATKEEIILAQTISISPNPVLDQLFISSPKASMLQIQILDVSGRLLKTFKPDAAHQTRMKLKNFQQGIYFIRIQSHDGKSIMKKVVKSGL